MIYCVVCITLPSTHLQYPYGTHNLHNLHIQSGTALCYIHLANADPSTFAPVPHSASDLIRITDQICSTRFVLHYQFIPLLGLISLPSVSFSLHHATIFSSHSLHDVHAADWIVLYVVVLLSAVIIHLFVYL